jgi:hypothetical protein
METESSFLCAEELAFLPYPDPDESNPHQTCFKDKFVFYYQMRPSK